MTSTIDRLIDSTVRCAVCGTQGFLACECGWHYPSPKTAAKLRCSAECRNPAHRAPPQDVACPHCKAQAGKGCRGPWRSERWPEGPPLAYHHARRVKASGRRAGALQ